MASKKSTRTPRAQQQKNASPIKRQKTLSSVRIIGGSMRGRKINFATEEGLRPTLDRIRETLFNWLSADIALSNCLDLFAGSGALGFESISRGAASVTFVDASSSATNNLKKNLAELKTDVASVVTDNAASFLSKNNIKFDIVFLDPPFNKGFLPHILEKLIPHLNAEAIVYVEQEVKDIEPCYSEHWQILKSKKTSQFVYQLLCMNKN